MASSAAHLDPKKGGDTLCEAFGAYGWSEGLKAMKWITDAISVRGVNWFVPHAFSPREYPDPDCPPHFYARGNNPQYPHFRKWADYTNRVCDLLSGGRHVAPVAVLYSAEAEWGGGCEPFEAAVKQLMRAQIDCDVVSTDLLNDCRIEEGCICLGGERFRALVIRGRNTCPRRWKQSSAVSPKPEFPCCSAMPGPGATTLAASSANSPE